MDANLRFLLMNRFYAQDRAGALRFVRDLAELVNDMVNDLPSPELTDLGRQELAR